MQWEIDGETEADFIFGGSKITADGDCSHEIKRHYQQITEEIKKEIKICIETNENENIILAEPSF